MKKVFEHIYMLEILGKVNYIFSFYGFLEKVVTMKISVLFSSVE